MPKILIFLRRHAMMKICTGSAGNAKAYAFCGSYDIAVTVDGETKVFPAEVSVKGGDIRVEAKF